MIKKFTLYCIVFSVICSLAILAIVLNEYDIIYLAIFTPVSFLIFLFILIFNLFLPYRRKLKAENNDLISDCSPSESIPTSAKPLSSWNSLAGFFMNKKDYYFDEQYFYEIASNRLIKIKLQDIRKINTDSLSVNNRKMWYVQATINGQIRTFRFFHNYTLWNNNFPEFLAYTKKVNPEADIKQFNIWTA